MPADIIPFSRWYSLRMIGDNRASLEIRGTIGQTQEMREWGFDAAGTARELEQELKAQGDVRIIDLYIYSLGGMVFEALAIHDILVRHPARIEAHVDGIAASSATIILMAADTIEVPSNAYLMIHNAAGCFCGDWHDMQKAAERLRQFTGDIAKMYVTRIQNKSNADDSAALLLHVLEMMDEETWLTGEEAVELGLADTTSEPVEIAAFAGSISNAGQVTQLYNFTKAPDPVRSLFDTSAQTNSEDSHSENTPTLIMSTSAAPTAQAPAAPAPAAPAAVATAPATPQQPTAEAPVQAPAAAPVAPVAPAPAVPVAPAPTAAPVAQVPAADPVAPAPAVAPVAQAPAAVPAAPVAPAPTAAPVAQVPAAAPAVAPVAPAPAATPAAPAATGPVTMEAISALVQPIVTKVDEMEAKITNQQNLGAAGVDPNAWGNTPPVEGVVGAEGDKGPINYAEQDPRALIHEGRKAMHG